MENYFKHGLLAEIRQIFSCLQVQLWYNIGNIAGCICDVCYAGRQGANLRQDTFYHVDLIQ